MIQELTTLLATIKSKAYIFLGAAFGLLLPIQNILLLVGFMIIADTAFGIWCAKKTGKKLTSSKLSAFISKMLVYQLTIISFYAIDKLILGEFLLNYISVPLVVTKFVALCLVANEIMSIDEKVVKVRGKGLWDMFKKMIGIAKYLKKEKDEFDN